MTRPAGVEAVRQKVRHALLRLALAGRGSDAALDPGRRIAAFNYDRGAMWHPSSHAKRQHLLRLRALRGHRTFIESGTYLGDTAAALARETEQVITIELDEALYRGAAERFRGDPTVEVRQGDAAVELPPAIADVSSAPLIWLDGHYSGGVTAEGPEIEPALTILRKIGSSAPDGATIVVDDLRLFGVDAGFPGLDELLATARGAFPSAQIRVGLDSLVIEA